MEQLVIKVHLILTPTRETIQQGGTVDVLMLLHNESGISEYAIIQKQLLTGKWHDMVVEEITQQRLVGARIPVVGTLLTSINLCNRRRVFETNRGAVRIINSTGTPEYEVIADPRNDPGFQDFITKLGQL
jgi:hypothetical protein